ncbi:MAG: response regulator transcription factor [Gemmataceae bacterium]|nr:response regulator transcription factor [Gemmataceae bacterium]
MLTLVLVDDHGIVREGLKALLDSETDFRLVGEAADGLQAVRQVERYEPDVVVMDLMMPGLNGIEAARQVVRRSPRTRVVILSMHSGIAYAAEAARAGATGYVLKEACAEELVQAIRAVAAGKRYFSPPLTEGAIAAYLRQTEGRPADPFETLTEREREVLQLTAEGHSGVEVAARLFISPRTVESHRASLMRKLGVHNQKELVRYAVQRGILADISRPSPLECPREGRDG